MATSKYTSKDIARFWSKVDKSDNADACWVWIAGTSKAGYGRFSWHYRNMHAHRIGYELSVGEIPDGLWVLHSCDNPRCVNPSHLFLGTRQDNIDDMNNKGRGVRLSGEQHGMRAHPERAARGSLHGRAKLTESDVLLIRQRFAAGGVSQAQLAREAGIGATTMFHILARHTWQHIP
jgi:hypothetical protein